MKKKWLFFIPLYLLSVLVAADCSTSEGIGFFDYCNILFCNIASYPLYGRSGWNLTVLFYYFLLLAGGLYFVTEPIQISEKGFHSFIMIRYGTCRRYLQKSVLLDAKRSILYVCVLLLVFLSAVCTVDIQAVAHQWSLADMSHDCLFLLFYILKLFTIYQIVQLLYTFFILNHTYSFLTLMGLIVLAVLLFADMFFQLGILTFAMDRLQIVFIIVSILVYLLSYVWIQKRYRKRELW